MAVEFGKVRWVSGPYGYGFIERDDGSTCFVHRSELQPRTPRPIQMGERVQFETELSLRGPQATRVQRPSGASAF